MIHCVVTAVLWSTLHSFYSSEAVARLDYQILLKSPPLTLLAGSAPGLRWTLVTKIHSVAVDRTPNLPVEKLTLYHWAIVTTPTCRAVCFNRGSASGCQGFSRKRPKLPGTKFTTTVICGCSNVDSWISVCIRFHEQRKRLLKVPLQQKGWKTLL